MKPQYEPKTTEQKLGYVVEECGEVLAAVGKSLRWGLNSVNPELPESERETNGSWILRELVDLQRAIDYARQDLVALGYRHDELEESARFAPKAGGSDT